MVFDRFVQIISSSNGHVSRHLMSGKLLCPLLHVRYSVILTLRFVLTECFLYDFLLCWTEVYQDRIDKPQFHSSTLPRTSTQKSLRSEAIKPQTLNVHVVKGPMGFGFTIADSSQGQRIKQIMDASRCQDLQEGDLLIEINGFNVQRYSHNEVVNMLKSCPRDTEAEIIVQRGGLFYIHFVNFTIVYALYYLTYEVAWL